ncbi:MAG: MarR family transcriptional regulator [Clostridia bacterium]
MDKKQLLIKFLGVMQDSKPDGKRKHRRKHNDEECKNHECRDEKTDEIRLPPSAKNTLMVLLEEKNLNQRTLAKRMNITAQGVSDVIKKLEEKELILRHRGEVYNENIIELTEKGEQTAKILDERTKIHSESLFENFTEDDLAKFDELLGKLNKKREKAD